ncbi:MAG: hypothetical protein GX267_01040 [Fibrobacter sp.]|jgi:hypothetical protein|nr:hypothetical protein [Fibrobacter sp.]
MDNLMEILIPIIFFIIWTLSSISASKKKQQRPAPPAERGPHPKPQYPSPANPMEDLKRTLENIFGELSEEEPDTVETQLSEGKKPPQPVEPPPIKVSESGVREKSPRQKTSFDSFSPQEEISFSVSQQELRKAIVLMEVLSPPVSMRE